MKKRKTEDKRICVVNIATGEVIPLEQAVITPVEFDSDRPKSINVGDGAAPLTDFIMSLCEFMLTQEESDLETVMDGFMNRREEA